MTMRLHRQLVVAAACACVLAAFSFSLRAAPPAKPDAVLADGGRYYGPLVNGVLQGRGVLEWDNGDRYEGDFAGGRFSGKGRLAWKNGTAYEGDFREGRMHGKGRMNLPGGTVYSGDFAWDFYSGKGRMEKPGDWSYEGDFKDGEFHGKGVYIEKNSQYRGDFRHGRYTGEGEAILPDGSKYRGTFDDGAWHGKGWFQNAAGEVYEGDFANNEFTGKGIYKRTDGGRFEGQFVKWQPQGPGKFIDSTGSVYEGSFTHGSLSGKGKYSGKNGMTYVGDFEHWHFQGIGELREANGDVYKGNFQFGKYHGRGTLTYAVPKNGKTQVSGDWEFGRPVEGGRDSNPAVVETALYNQRRLLDETLATVAASDPAKLDMYLLIVAGDGRQEVFRREIDFVRGQFDKRFRTGPRTVALVNSRNTISAEPMATVTSVGESIKAIAAKMDKDNDILFVYLSSHGSKDHALTLAQDNIQLRDLPAKDLAAMLKASGIRWKVIVVSACYAGGFINPLKDEQTLIITAARSDRRSFGCGDDNDFTYFGEAYFRDALPASTSFQEAFEKARAIVEKREAADQKGNGKPDEQEFSRPQMSSTGKIDDHLRKWWAQSGR